MKFIARSQEPRPASLGRPEVDRSRTRRDRSRGQVVVIFAGAAFVLFALTALVIDVSWYWANTLKVQRAADAAALAGVVWLPGQAPTAVNFALTEATKNGYQNPVGGCVAKSVCVAPTQDSDDPRQLDVTISAPVPTFFMRLIGIQSLTATRTSKALYVQKVPMGSPLAWYGVGCFDLSSGTDPACTTGASHSNDKSGVPSSTAYAGAMPAPNASSINSQGFWGSIEPKGGERSNGDAFATYYNGKPTTNLFANNGTTPVSSQYDSAGYNYVVNFTTAGGSVYVFDPTFCDMGVNPSGSGNYGAGDHWLSGTNAVSTYYTLWDTKGTPFTEDDDRIVASSGTLFQGLAQSDHSNGGDGSVADCANNQYHNKWWRVGTNAAGCAFDPTALLISGFSGCGSASNLAVGTYRLQIQSSKDFPFVADPNINLGTNGQNMFSIMATGGGTASVYGAGRMAAYNNLANGTQLFYLAQIDKTAAGKTVEIDLFDPGDVAGNATLRILSPDGNAYNPVKFNYVADSNCIAGQSDACSDSASPASRTSIKTAVSSNSSFDNSWIQFTISLGANYGCAQSNPSTPCLTPVGEPGAGWWKIEYTVGSASDLTTWMVNVRGNPVHLILP